MLTATHESYLSRILKFLDQVGLLIPCRYSFSSSSSSSASTLLLVWAARRFKFDRDENEFGRNVSQVNTNRFTESDFGYDVILSRRRPWRHLVKSFCPAAYDVIGSLYALEYLIRSTFILVFQRVAFPAKAANWTVLTFGTLHGPCARPTTLCILFRQSDSSHTTEDAPGALS